mgnify:CR=1 FL=1
MKANGNRVVTRGNSDATEQIRKTRMPPNTSHLFAQMLVKRLRQSRTKKEQQKG